MLQPEKPLTVDEVVAMAKRQGEIQCNPIRYHEWRGLAACEQAVKLGLLTRKRHRLDLLCFYPVSTETQPVSRRNHDR